MTLMIFLSILSALTLSSFFVTSQIIIQKCCRNGEELSVSVNSAFESKCVPSNVVWKPFIYSPTQRRVIPIPLAWTIQEGIKPQCRENHALTLVPCSKYSPCIIFDDGNVTLGSRGAVMLTPTEYCADSKALIICMAQKVNTITVYRCCGDNAVFHENRNSCVNQRDSEDDPPLLSNTVLKIDFIPGFPRCRQSDNITIISETKGSVLNLDGGLNIDRISLPPTQYCVERVKELNNNAKVFACSEYAPQRPELHEMDIWFMIYPVSIIISAIFLAITLATSCLLPASHHVLHWRCQTHYIVCLMLGDLLMAVIQLASGSLTSGICKPI
ncbi:hypothetical protein PV325_008185, partial [Microctonus aethiopoides]